MLVVSTIMPIIVTTTSSQFVRHLQATSVIAFLLFASACATVSPKIQSNGVILWSNGIEERVQVSPSNDHLVFVHSGVLNGQVVVYSRIIGASTAACEYYVNEPNPQVRLTICHQGEVELLDQGQTLNIGQLTVFTS
ncbi:hypothetical protein LRP50_23275 [Enterovibrio sp. ZSDZ42]|uniref:Uncharacterized protein n=1 Tax=Enterovibrio gelatinilyticus TaxID=2899819 RepID=A0ABT5R8G9_9GAMM|nr:hypothetical protein [Enterovibrio sp. ZSDZ42]MDD1796046.1 hypothetical protein [Enterovibrio sp. ZSDZ42]